MEYFKTYSSNTIDSTFSDGTINHKNLAADAWKIEEMFKVWRSYQSRKNRGQADEHTQEFWRPVIFPGSLEKKKLKGRNEAEIL